MERNGHSRVIDVSNALMKAHFAGIWTSGIININQILSTPVAKMHFDVARLSSFFDIAEPGYVLGRDGYYYARITQHFDLTGHTQAMDDYIIRFSPSGNLYLNGYEVYARYTIPGNAKASANSFYSSVDTASVWTQISQGNIPAGLPEPMLFRPTTNYNQLWDLVQVVHPPDMRM